MAESAGVALFAVTVLLQCIALLSCRPARTVMFAFVLSFWVILIVKHICVSVFVNQC